MTEKQAIEQGLHFTGMYSSNKDETKSKIEEERKKYPLARIVLVNTPYTSRSGKGYSAYACNKYSAYQTLESLGNIEENHNKRLTDLINTHLANIATEEARLLKEKDEAQKALSILAAYPLPTI